MKAEYSLHSFSSPFARADVVAIFVDVVTSTYTADPSPSCPKTDRVRSKSSCQKARAREPGCRRILDLAHLRGLSGACDVALDLLKRYSGIENMGGFYSEVALRNEIIVGFFSDCGWALLGSKACVASRRGDECWSPD